LFKIIPNGPVRGEKLSPEEIAKSLLLRVRVANRVPITPGSFIYDDMRDLMSHAQTTPRYRGQRIHLDQYSVIRKNKAGVAVQ
jgi:hypothetical protein